MAPYIIREFLPSRAAAEQAAVLTEVLREAWADRRLHRPGSPERVIAEVVSRDLLERLRWLGRHTSDVRRTDHIAPRL